MPGPTDKRRIAARRTELGASTVAGGIGTAFGAAKLRDAYKEEHPERFRSATMRVGQRAHKAGMKPARAERLVRTMRTGKPKFVALATLTAAGSTAAGANRYHDHRVRVDAREAHKRQDVGRDTQIRKGVTTVSAFGIDHGYALGSGEVSKAKVPFAEMHPFEQMKVMSGQQARIRRNFARKYPAGEHDVAVGDLRRLSGSKRDFTNPEHEARVRAITPSIRDEGMRNPVEVRRYRPQVGSAKRSEADFHSGGHRLEAARRLGMKRVRTVVTSENGA